MMVHVLVRRLLLAVPTLLGVTLLIFLIAHATPGSPWDREGQRALPNYIVSEEAIRTLSQQYGLDLPLWRQYLRFMVGDFDAEGQFVCGAPCLNFGPSMRIRGFSVQQLLFSAGPDRSPLESRFLYSIRLVLLALVFAVGVGVPVGMLAAARRHSAFDYISSILMTACLSIPNFAIGLVVLIVFASWLHLVSFTTTSWADPRAWLLPGAVLSLGLMGTTARLTRNSMLEALSQDYVRTARGKGLEEFIVVTVHVLKNALLPVITYLGPAWVELVAASFVVEQMFGFPGFGREFVSAVTSHDYTMILGAVVIYAILVVGANLVVDLLYAAIDPRIRVE